jgi:hypothetical protein
VKENQADERWEPIEIPQLRIGHYIKINHRWFDHPFVRRMFEITSERELAIIREVALTRIFVDQNRSAPAIEAAANVEAAPPAAGAQPDNALEAAALKAQREGLAAAQARARATLERAQYANAALNYGDARASVLLDEFVDYLVALLNNSTTPLALLAASLQGQSAQRLALLGSDAVSMAAVIGKRMGLKAPALRTLTRAAATHLLGLARMPAHTVDEEADGAPARTPLYRSYPLLGATILEKCGGFSEDVLRIVREHREKPDGRGFPQGLSGDAIHPHALIVGAVREFLLRSGNGKSPVTALAYLNKHMRQTFGTEIIGHLANSILTYPAGTHVQLSDGRVARVLRSEEAMRLSPLVEVFEDTNNLRNRATVDLSQRRDLSIVRVLDTSRLPPRMFETGKRSLSSEPPKPEKPGEKNATAEVTGPAPPAAPPAAAPASATSPADGTPAKPG